MVRRALLSFDRLQYSTPTKTTLFSIVAATLFTIFALPTSVFSSSQPYLPMHQVNFGIGNKYHVETDVNLAGLEEPFVFKRNYNNQVLSSGPFGYGWSSIGTLRLSVVRQPDTCTSRPKWHSQIPQADCVDPFPNLLLTESSGRSIQFINQGTHWQTGLRRVRTITAIPNGYQLKEPNGVLHIFSAGQRVETRKPNGYQQWYTYNASGLATVSDSFGRHLSFEYNAAGQVIALKSPVGTFYYHYDNNNLTEVRNPDGTSRQYLYEDPQDAHNLTGIIDGSGERIITVIYDDQGRVVESRLTGGRDSIKIEYPSRLSRRIIDSNNVVSVYTLIDINGMLRVQSFTGVACNSCGEERGTQYTFSQRGQILEITNEVGQVTRYTYDDWGNRVTKTEAAGTPQERVTHQTFQPESNQLLSTATSSIARPGQNKVVNRRYDAQGNLIAQQTQGYDAKGTISQQVTYGYDSWGRLMSRDGSRTDTSDLTHWTYYPNDPDQGPNRAQLHQVKNSLGQITSYRAYTPLGKPGQIITPTTEINLTYDLMGRVLTRTSQGLRTTFRYDGAGRLLEVTRPTGAKMNYQYDGQDRLAYLEDDAGHRLQYGYDSRGNLVLEEIQDADGQLTHFMDRAYDADNRLTRIDYANGSSETRSYDSANNLSKTINGLGQATLYQYDPLARLTQVTAADNSVTQYNYDRHDNLVTVIDAKDQATHYTFDDLGRRVIRHAPDSGETRYQYDAANNLIALTNSNGITQTYSYDALNRLTHIQYPDRRFNVQYQYNAAGYLSRQTDNTGTRQYGYDPQGNLITETWLYEHLHFTTQYHYDAFQQLIGLTYPSGLRVDYQRNLLGQVIEVTATLRGKTQTLASGISYLPFGPMVQLTYGNGLSRRLSYDQAYQLTGMATGLLETLSYQRDLIGNITEINDELAPSQSQRFGYDTVNRLHVAAGEYGNLRYLYDSVGNRQTKEEDGAVTHYSYTPDSNQLATLYGQANRQQTYDPMGNLLSKGQTHFQYHETGRLAQVTTDSLIARYEYNSQSQRVSKTVNGKTRLFLYDLMGNLIAESNDQGVIKKEYFQFQGQPLAVLEAPTTSSGFTDAHEDGQLADWRAVGQRDWIEDKGQVSPAPNSRDSGFLIHPFSTAADGTLSLEITADPWNGHHGGVVFRWTDENNFYFVTVQPGNQWRSALVLHKNSLEGPGIQIAGPLNIGADYQLRVELKGDTFQFYLDDQFVGRFTDSDHPTGQVGYGYRGYYHDKIDFKEIRWQQAGESPLEDRDNDNIADRDDNCPDLANPSQADTDQDRTGDLCELAGLSDQHEDGFLTGWTRHGLRDWQEINGQVSPAQSTRETGFLINDYPCLNDGTLEAEIQADAWSGHHGGLVFRWTDENNFYRVTVQPGNPWRSQLVVHKNSLTGRGIVIASPLKIGTTYTLKVVLKGAIFDFYLDGKQVGSWTDSDHPNGQVGYAYSNYYHDKIDFNRFSWGEKDPNLHPEAGIGGLYYVHTDHLGTPQYLTRQDGVMAWQAQYHPFGQTVINDDPDGNGQSIEYNIRFPGQYADMETGLYYNWHRYYDPEVGRYITADPIGLFGGINLYAYVDANPVNEIDPTGEIIFTLAFGAGTLALAGDVALVGGVIWATQNPSKVPKPKTPPAIIKPEDPTKKTKPLTVQPEQPIECPKPKNHCLTACMTCFVEKSPWWAKSIACAYCAVCSIGGGFSTD